MSRPRPTSSPTRAAEFDACSDPAALENAKARYLGKAGALTELLKGSASSPPRSGPPPAPRSTRRRQRSKTRSTARRDSARRREARGTARGRCARRVAAGPRTRRRHAASAHAHAGAHRDALPLARLRGRRRPGDRGRLPQLHGAQHAGEPSGALDARHVLRRGRAWCCARTRRRCRCATWKRTRRRSRSSRRAACIASTATRRTRRCSTRSRACGSTAT